MADDRPTVLFIEPLYGGSHKQLIDLLVDELPGDLFTLPASKWHWRMRTSALHFSLTVPHKDSYRTLFASSVLNLCELVSLRPDLGKLHKVLYFHENQLVYPVRRQQDRDFQYGYNEILSCLVADKVVFNSQYNMNSFLGSIDSHLKLIPDHRPRGLAEIIRPKCTVLYFPLKIERTLEITGCIGPLPPLGQENTHTKHSSIDTGLSTIEPSHEDSDKLTRSDSIQCHIKDDSSTHSSTSLSEAPCADTNSGATTVGAAVRPLHIVWPHRWEHDKGPDELSSVITKLLDAGMEFKLSILGAHTNDIPDSFSQLFPLLGSRLVHRGAVPRTEYWQVLECADVVVSTSKHEFFGVAMLEAVACGCYPLCPSRLVYPELYPEECLYNTEQQLFKRLKRFCQHPHLAREKRIHELMCLEKFQWEKLKTSFQCLVSPTSHQSVA